MWPKDITIIHCQLTYYKLLDGKVYVCLTGKSQYTTWFEVGIMISHALTSVMRATSLVISFTCSHSAAK